MAARRGARSRTRSRGSSARCPQGAAEAAERALAWTHLLLVLGFLVFLPKSKHLHILTAAPNVYLAKNGPGGRLEPLRIDLEAPQDGHSVRRRRRHGPRRANRCSTCSRAPSAAAARRYVPHGARASRLSPKLLIMGLRDHVTAECRRDPRRGRRRRAWSNCSRWCRPRSRDEVVWDCVTCGACVRECPVDIEHVDTIVDLRRNLVMAESRFPAEAGSAPAQPRDTGRTRGASRSRRAPDWAEGIDGVRVLAEGETPPEYLYWVGCAGAFDDRARATARSVAQLLGRRRASTSRSWVRASCAPATPRGGWGTSTCSRCSRSRTWQRSRARGSRRSSRAARTASTRSRTSTPTTAGRFEVIHHTELLAYLVSKGALAAGRRVRDAARSVLPRAPQRRLRARRARCSAATSPRCRGRRSARSAAGRAGRACGWRRTTGTRINAARIEEAAGTGADTVAVACPYCLVMLDDGAKETGTRPAGRRRRDTDGRGQRPPGRCET